MHIPALFCTNDVVFAHSVVLKSMWFAVMAEGRYIPMREGEKGIGSLSLALMTLLWEIDLPRGTRKGCGVWHKQVVCLCQTAIVVDPNGFTARDERDPRVLIPEEVSRHARDRRLSMWVVRSREASGHR